MYPNIFHKEFTLNPAQLEPIQKEVNSIYLGQTWTDRVNHKFPLEDSVAHIDSIVSNYIRYYDQEYHYPRNLQVFKQPRCLALDDCWVNFMGPGEHSPIHNHGGVMSWCLWLKIPYTIDEEYAASSWIPRSNNYNGQFAFHYTNTLGQVQTQVLPMDTTKEGTLAIWPSSLQHSVFPYYSTRDIRVTVAGNYYFED